MCRRCRFPRAHVARLPLLRPRGLASRLPADPADLRWCWAASSLASPRPTEAGAVGAVGACLMAAAQPPPDVARWSRDAAMSTARITGLVMMILFCSDIFQRGL
jgi:hypothetical protein